MVAKTMDVPIAVLDSWKQRKQQIFPAESFAPIMASVADPLLFRGRDVLWFIDNEAAASTIIRGATREEDVQGIAELTQFFWASLRCRVWIEWIDSDSNPSDGLSREGLLCEWCSSRGVKPEVATPPAWSSPSVMLESLISAVEGK